MNNQQTPNKAPVNTAALRNHRAATLAPEGLYRWDEFEDRIPYSRETWRQRVKAGEAPRPAMKSRGRTAWRGADLLAWLADPDGYSAQTSSTQTT